MESLLVMMMVFGFFVVVFYVHVVQQRERDAALEFLSRERGGLLQSTSLVWEAFSKVWELPVPAGVARVYFHTTGGKAPTRSTRFVLQVLSGRLPRIEIYPQNALHALAKLLGMQDIEIGDHYFDEEFILKADDERKLRSFLSDENRALVLRTHRLGPGFYLHALPDRLELRVDDWLSGADLVQFFDRCAALAASLTGTQETVTPGITFEGAVVQCLPAADPAGAASCLVCGNPLTERPVVRCRRCDTPHHEECWKYNERCAVYGCTETRCVAGSMARRA